ncbi:MAG: hypothetical protein WA990_14370, partial [Rubrobacteraceae bacterium]
MKPQSLLRVQIIGVVSILLFVGGCNTAGESGPSTINAATNGNTSYQRDGSTREAKDGPTEAPNLLSVSDFREGPTTPQGEPTTLVDFEFDQKAYLKGGDRTSFHL